MIDDSYSLLSYLGLCFVQAYMVHKLAAEGSGMAYSRRECLLMAGALSSAAPCRRAKAANSPAEYPRNLTKTDIERGMKELSNWGRWGDASQAGTINLITPAKRKQAAALVKDGVSFSMSLEADLPPEGDVPPSSAGVPGGGSQRPRFTWEHVMRSTGTGRVEGFAIDTISTSFHGSATTHMDALSAEDRNGYHRT